MIKVKCGQTMINAIRIIFMHCISDNDNISEIIYNIVETTGGLVVTNDHYINDLYFIKYRAGYSQIKILNDMRHSFNIGYYIDDSYTRYKNYLSSTKEKQYIIEFTQEEFDLIMSVSKSIGGISVHRMAFSYMYSSKGLRSYQKYEYCLAGCIYTMDSYYMDNSGVKNIYEACR